MFLLNVLSFFFLPISRDYSACRCWVEKKIPVVNKKDPPDRNAQEKDLA